MKKVPNFKKSFLKGRKANYMCKRVCFKAAAVSIIVLICMIGIAQATPSSTFWTPMTPDIQPYGVLHIGVDNYFSVGSKTLTKAGINNSFPTDVGDYYRRSPLEKLQMEIGVDYLQPIR